MGRVCDEFRTGRYCPNQSCGCAIQSWNSDQASATPAISSAMLRFVGIARTAESVLATRS
jgi:hypothetical protein